MYVKRHTVRDVLLSASCKCACLQVLSLRYSDWCRLKTPEERARYMWHIRDASALRTPLAPDVVRVGGQQQESSSKPQKSLTQQLWRLLVD
jgi:hypothetical protein